MAYVPSLQLLCITAVLNIEKKDKENTKEDINPYEVQQSLIGRRRWKKQEEPTESQKLAKVLSRMPEVKLGIKLFLVKRAELKHEAKTLNKRINILVSNSAVPLEVYSHHLKQLFTQNYGGQGFEEENTCKKCLKEERSWRKIFRREVSRNEARPRYRRDGHSSIHWKIHH